MNATEKRRPGRPSLATTGPRAHVDAIVTPELRRRIRIAAAAADLAMGEWLRRAAEEKLSRDA